MNEETEGWGGHCWMCHRIAAVLYGKFALACDDHGGAGCPECKKEDQ